MIASDDGHISPVKIFEWHRVLAFCHSKKVFCQGFALLDGRLCELWVSFRVEHVGLFQTNISNSPNVIYPFDAVELIGEYPFAGAETCFGNAGKMALTKPGYQLMEKFGGYFEYLEATKNTEQNETSIIPVDPMPKGPKVKHITPPEHGKTDLLH